ncbi:MAG: alpha/beta fold hydrolase [Methyloceanibacter sp.]|uniref:alpha/beta fold hydrolase n=1 Tax=Methyloceanibacter sp. TaxID=1965321 RepID=UPI003D6C8A9D
MVLSRLKAASATLAVATFVLLGTEAGAIDQDPWFARLGPPDAPVNLFYEEQGTGAPVLLIHGFGASTYTWRRIAPELATGHRVIAVDLKGFGQSDKPFDTRYSVFDQAELLTQFIEDHDLRDLTIVGHSFGGGVALVLALDDRLKDRITRLVLIDSIAYPQNIPVFFRMLDMPLFSHLGVRMVPPAVQTRIALQIAYFDNSKIGDEEVEVYAAPLRTAAGKHAIIHSARQIVPEDLEEISRRYRSIAVPTLIMWCDHDRIVPLDVGIKLRRTLPKSTLKIVEGCGHMPQEEQPEATLGLLQGFLGG